MPITHRHLHANGIRFHIAEAGAGPLVLLLHGFPEFSYSWRKQMAALAVAGYHVVAPDLRGYGQTERPAGGYEIPTLTRDVIELIHALGETSAVVAGHDWGGVIAWYAAMEYPAAIRKLIILNAPHPARLQELLLRSTQALRMLYILFFKLPRLPEFVMRQRHGWLLEKGMLATSKNQQAFSEEDLRLYRETILAPGALKAALAYYRNIRPQPVRVIRCPTLVLWSDSDPALPLWNTDGLEPWVTDLKVEVVQDCGHWLQQEQPWVVTREMLDFLSL